MLQKQINSDDHVDSDLDTQRDRLVRKICGRTGLLPSSFVLSKQDLRRTSPYPITTGGCADVYRGEYKGQKVALKSLRVNGGDDSTLKRARKVCPSILLCEDRSAMCLN